MRPPRRLRGPDSPRVPFLQTLRTSRGVLSPAAWFLRGESSVWPLVLALENVSSHLPQHSTAQQTLPCPPRGQQAAGTGLVNQVQRQLIAQQQPSTGLKTGALSDRAVPLCFLAKKQCQGDEVACSESQFASSRTRPPTHSSSPSQEPSCPWGKDDPGLEERGLQIERDT